MKRVTLKDIAKASGYSANCVSRALMDADDISVNTKQRIRRIAEEMGYVPNRSASILRKGNSNRIGILCDSLLNPYYSVMINYMQFMLLEHGYTFVTLYSHNQLFSTDDVKQVMSSDVDGLISMFAPDDDAAAMLKKLNIPTVILGRKAEGFDYVVLDNYKGGYIITQRLVDKGAKNIVYIGENRTIDCSLDRCAGYEKALEDNGLTPNVYFAYEVGSYERAVELLVQSGEPFDAIFCFNDFGAYIVMDKLAELGITGKTIAGFDEIRKELRFYSKVDTVGYDKQAFSEKAVELLLKRIRCSNIGDVTVHVEDVYLV